MTTRIAALALMALALAGCWPWGWETEFPVKDEPPVQEQEKDATP